MPTEPEEKQRARASTAIADASPERPTACKAKQWTESISAAVSWEAVSRSHEPSAVIAPETSPSLIKARARSTVESESSEFVKNSEHEEESPEAKAFSASWYVLRRGLSRVTFKFKPTLISEDYDVSYIRVSAIAIPC
jgi:hypothetical protein